MFFFCSFSLSAKMTSAFHFGGSVTLKTTVGTARTSLQTAVSDDSSLTALSHNNISLLLCVVVVVFLWLLIYCVLSLQLSLSAGQANSSVVQASAPTRPTSVMETMIARTTLMRPTAVHTHTHTYNILNSIQKCFLRCSYNIPYSLLPAICFSRHPRLPAESV